MREKESERERKREKERERELYIHSQNSFFPEPLLCEKFCTISGEESSSQGWTA